MHLRVESAKDYKSGDSAYQKFLGFSQSLKIKLYTSHLCIEEWRSQKVSHSNKTFQDQTNKLIDLKNSNLIVKAFSDAELNWTFPSPEQVVKKSQKLIQDFLKENNIEMIMPAHEHIAATWDGYFIGSPPFKSIKNRKDIPDAWIYECAKDVLNMSDNSQKNKFCIGGDGTLCDALGDLGFENIEIVNAVEMLEKEESGVVLKKETTLPMSVKEPEAQYQVLGTSTLDELLKSAPNKDIEGIYLRLLGYVGPLGTPTHEELIRLVALKGYDTELVRACAVILSDRLSGFLKNTGSHYIIGNREVCDEAASILTVEFIELLGRGES